MRPTYVVRSRWSRAVAVLGCVACAVVAAGMALDGGEKLVGRLAWVALAALVLWALWWRPCVRVSDGGIDVDDVLRDTHVPWPAVTGVESRWSLTVTSAEGRYSSWAVPAGSPGGLGDRVRGALGRDAHGTETDRARQTAPEASDDDGRARTEKVRGTATTVAELAAERQDALRAAGFLRDGPVPPVAHRWHVGTGAAAAALVTAGLLLG
ncbi:MAG: PH domain-containing protein [Actinomycetaceae bacterium]